MLNEIGTPAHVKYLLQSIKDDDWWVRSRAADALAKIGGPRVIEASLELIRDKDEDVRRAFPAGAAYAARSRADVRAARRASYAARFTGSDNTAYASLSSTA